MLSRRVELLQAVKAKIAKLQGKAQHAPSLFLPKSNRMQRVTRFTGKEFEAVFITPVDVRAMASYLGIEPHRCFNPRPLLFFISHVHCATTESPRSCGSRSLR